MWAFGDPVREGLINKLSRPGSNLTGLTDSVVEMQVKRLEFLKELVPGMRRLAVVSRKGAIPQYVAAVDEEVGRAAKRLGFTHEWFFPTRAEDFEPLFESLRTGGFDSVFLAPSPLADANQALLGKLSRAVRLPTVSGGTNFVEAGGLLSFSVNYDYNVRRAAGYVDKILRGADPAVLPVEEPSEFMLVINATTAKELGIHLPSSLVSRATRILD